MGIWVYKTNTDSDIDPDWGTKAALSNCIYKVVVEPKVGGDWQFYLILPSDGDSEEELFILCQQACENFLGRGDHYAVSELGQKDIEEFNNAIPILMYSPLSKGEFVWMTPPGSIKN